jgi:hypothetical protein
MSIQANASGQVSGRFVIPTGVPVGAKLVEFVGRGGATGQATFVGRGQITTRELQQVRTETTIITNHLEAYDPVAETFTLANPAFISSVDLWVTAKGSSGTTLVQIRETDNGVPTRAVVAEQRVTTPSLLLNQWMRFSWVPVRLEANVEYALVIGCDDGTTAVAVAELGKFDSAQNRWVTSQAYQIGVLLSSSNGATWTPHQEKDLTFRLNATPLSATTRVIALPDQTVSGADELIILAAVERPTSDTDVTFTVTLPGDISFTVAEGERVLLPVTVTGIIKWAANLSGTTTSTPRLHKDLQLVTASRLATGTYLPRAITAGTGSKVSVYYEALTPSTSTVLIEVSADGVTGWATVPVVAGVQLGDGWIDTTARLTGFNGALAFVRITETGSARARPQIRKLRVAIT